ncbi:MAG: SUMF1/EgtB/PvdO family nonheme iron enzyme, partial [Chitinispirillaceae bacterium]|nr:SUMF1/EgtB/PvdO family nonheme iron enzyme [Chitinispirillaceae bacterium]
MLGNVWEWVNDYYDPAAYEFSDENDPEGPDAGFYRVIRGGGWYSVRSRISVSDRQWFSPAYSEVSIGFRCVKK